MVNDSMYLHRANKTNNYKPFSDSEQPIVTAIDGECVACICQSVSVCNTYSNLNDHMYNISFDYWLATKQHTTPETDDEQSGIQIKISYLF